jgi:Spy/CpxP family protein refolding chaperone
MENKRTGRQALASVIVVFVLGIALGGIATYVREERVWGSQSIPRHGAMQQFAREANLTPDQQKQIQSIVDDTKVKYRQLYDPLDAQREAIRRDGRGRIRAVLTPDQQIKFDEFIRRLDQARAQQPQQ